MTREMIHFAHGNGFPARCYSQLLRQLSENYECCYLEKFGHDPAFPVTDNWQTLVKELLASIRRQCKQPIIGVGHSLGGILNFLASIEEPSLFKMVIMIDSPLLGRFKSNMIRLAKRFNLIDRLTPALRTSGRRTQWETKEALQAYLKKRPLFKTFSADCLQDYIDYGTTETEQGFTLNFDRGVEYLIYRTIPHILYEFEGQLSVPTALIYGDKSTVIDRYDVHYMKKYYNIPSVALPGTHMLPMENPQMVAKTIIELIHTTLYSK